MEKKLKEKVTLKRKVTLKEKTNVTTVAKRKEMIDFLGIDAQKHNLQQFAEEFGLEYKPAHTPKKGACAEVKINGKTLNIEGLCRYLGIDYNKRKNSAPKTGARKSPASSIDEAIETLAQIGLKFSKVQIDFLEKEKSEIIAKAAKAKAEAAKKKAEAAKKAKALSLAASLSLQELEMLIKNKQ